jgi:hypothetical protein
LIFEKNFDWNSPCFPINQKAQRWPNWGYVIIKMCIQKPPTPRGKHRIITPQKKLFPIKMNEKFSWIFQAI